jgi:hypothetical protein
MARTHKDAVRQNSDLHADAPYWKYGWAYRHGRKRDAAKLRRLRNRRTRARARDALVNEQEPWPEHRDMKYIFW